MFKRALVLGAVVAAPLLLWLGSDSSAEAGQERAPVEPKLSWIANQPAPAPAGPAEAVAPGELAEPHATAAPRVPRPRQLDPIARTDTALETDLETLVDRWFVRAREVSGGKLTGPETEVSVHVRDLATGATIADLRGSRLMRPASNLKLLTTAAGLVLMGPEGEFVTPFGITGRQSGAVVDGDLVVLAGGDPFCKDGSLGAVEARLDAVAEQLRQGGIRHIRGDLVLDEGDFLEPGIGPAWPSSNQHWADYCALAAGLTLNGGVLEARVTPGAVGAKASLEVHPAPHGLDTKYGVMTVPGTASRVLVGATTNRVTVSGKYGASNQPYEAAFRHPDPVGLFGAVLRDRLERGGISIDGETVRRRGPPEDLRLVGSLRSPITDSLVPINTHSNNGVADQLFFTLGHHFGGGGTRAGGQRAVVAALEQLGIDTAGLVQVDGSGLSRDNLVAPTHFTGLLAAALVDLDAGDLAARQYLQSLAIAGVTGTLERRMRGGPAQGRCFAKTGFIDGTSSLSGLVRTADGRDLVFSILVNYPSISSLNTRAWKPMQDAMVERLVTGTL
ncbi:MAG: D-alanyl-D-alanine carboxypeptidase/D-alanyl-D-alanine-endopeptidase [Planctomycetota bacterium]|nr:D-alanyl-D-alanine carboxypeptidase/D-alanyl-D-alanine-endopeptidase [Planctomycetota bacterium]